MAVVEYRSHRDDAWYDVRLVTENVAGDLRLRIHLLNFSEDEDEFVYAKDLTSFQDLDQLRSRIRRQSEQLQDSECSAVDKGLLVCASRTFHPDDRRFYDAFVDSVVHKRHRFVGGDEECRCSFILEWIHGPQAGTVAALTLENICRVLLPAVDEEIDPALTSFFNAAKEKIDNSISSLTSVEVSVEKGSEYDKDSSRLRKRHRGSTTERLDKDGTHGRGSLVSCSSSKEIRNSSSTRGGQDTDIGGAPHMIFVENLEKGISSSTIMEFMYQHLSISCQAFVSPSKPFEAYTRGTIMLNNKKNLDKLSKFLASPDHIIISSRGRPWVVTEKLSLDDTKRGSIETLKLSQTSLACQTRCSKDLKVVISGSQEYTKAKQLKDLFMVFTDHQCGLHQRLLHEEGKILQQHYM